MFSESPRIKVRVESRIGALGRAAWNRVVPDGGFYLSHQWLAAVERDPTCSPFYLVAASENDILGVLPLYEVGYELSPYYTLGVIMGCGEDVSQRSVLIAGTRRGFRNVVCIDSQLAVAQRVNVLQALILSAADFARSRGKVSVVWPYTASVDAAQIQEVTDCYSTVASPEAVLELPGTSFDEWLGSLGATRRHSVRQEIRRAERSGLAILIERVPADLTQLAELACNVERKYGRRSTTAGMQRWIRFQVEALAERTVLVCARDSKGRLLAFSLCYRWRDGLFPRVVGIDYSITNRKYAYFHVAFYEPVRYMYDMRLSRLFLGIESYEAKLQRGARLSQLYHVRLDVSR